MAILIKQRGPASGTSGQNGQAAVPYLVIATENEEYPEARVAFQQKLPVALDDLYLTSVSLEPNGIDTRTNRQWEGWARYTKPGVTVFPQPGYAGRSFEITGATTHITQAKEHVATYAADGYPELDYDGAIGVTRTGEVEGCDIPTAEQQWTITWVFNRSDANTAWEKKVAALVGKVNNAPFKGRPAYSVRFDGARGQERADGMTEVTFHFAESPNRDDLMVGSIGPIEKDGWDYLWAEYAEVYDETLGLTKTIPIRVHVDAVLDEGDFKGLGIGTT